MKSIWRKTISSQIKYETEIFDRHAGHYGFGGREGERMVDYFRGSLRETDKKKYSFKGIVFIV